MRPLGQLKHFGYAFLIAVFGYVVLYNLIERARVRRTPWEITFSQTNGTPVLIVTQTQLAPQPRMIRFPGVDATALSQGGPETLVFDQPRPVPFPVPFGRCIFLDTTFLPGTAAFELFGHTIELMPRALIIDNDEHPWGSNFREVEAKGPKVQAMD